MNFIRNACSYIYYIAYDSRIYCSIFGSHSETGIESIKLLLPFLIVLISQQLQSAVIYFIATTSNLY